jgi:hypothetical protein
LWDTGGSRPGFIVKGGSGTNKRELITGPSWHESGFRHHLGLFLVLVASLEEFEFYPTEKGALINHAKVAYNNGDFSP